ncbi:hypothetical protein BCR36DRAFT_64654 [Piromyces finnis]|uniref:Uncharacterized protein n=1 Tax=Piromyces finnis TaxID=1754191 RepID=A0A1Y1V960_9FUNG|nr:hypothetical protein BCR36DRAFT_64654 [Piromyces finnis]|eukprot:ORX49616.1 hypothetical protein BCR36DRAFT_64654 [Piromyces finnis]
MKKKLKRIKMLYTLSILAFLLMTLPIINILRESKNDIYLYVNSMNSYNKNRNKNNNNIINNNSNNDPTCMPMDNTFPNNHENEISSTIDIHNTSSSHENDNYHLPTYEEAMIAETVTTNKN